MNDASTNVAQLKQLVADFVAERDWQRYHVPKHLVMSIMIEAAELMEHFQWIGQGESRAIADDPVRLAAVGEEIADVFAYSLALADVLGLDMADTVRAKMVKNVAKYPAEEFRGRYGPEDNGENSDSGIRNAA